MKKPNKKPFPLKEEEIENLKNFPWDFGIETKEEDIDEIHYGE